MDLQNEDFESFDRLKSDLAIGERDHPTVEERKRRFMLQNDGGFSSTFSLFDSVDEILRHFYFMEVGSGGPNFDSWHKVIRQWLFGHSFPKQVVLIKHGDASSHQMPHGKLFSRTAGLLVFLDNEQDAVRIHQVNLCLAMKFRASHVTR
jgi:hypothetical protein